MKFAASILAFASVASALAPITSSKKTALRMADASSDEKTYPSINGWVADPSKFCAGLPGSSFPLENFDPINLIGGLSIEEIKRYRESEVTHGRVAMLATMGYLVGESFHPFFGGVIEGAANSHLGQVREIAPPFFVILTVAIGACELLRAKIGWQTPPGLSKIVDDPNRAFGARLLDKYYPGDIGFDPLGLKPKDAKGFATRQTKELNNGRLAMIAAAGMIVQEQITHETIAETLKTIF
jgi:Chlorophyll A-B binding protein